MLTSQDWVMSDNDCRALMTSLMMIACTFDDGEIPYDEDYIARVAYFKKVNLKPLFDIGFIEFVENDTETYQSVPKSIDSVSVSVSESRKGGMGEKSEVPPSTRGSPPADIPLPDVIPKKDWDDFVDMRKSMKKPLTLRAKEILIKKLTDWFAKGHSPSEILQNSVANNWQGLFEPKTSTKGNYNGKTSIHQPSQAATDARRSVLANLVRERESGQHPAMAS